jgi:hypothetical protein
MFLSSLPLLLAVVAMVIVVRKAGVFEQRAHRQRVEALLERIAVAVEKSGRSTS